jgi:hypothetical protein
MRTAYLIMMFTADTAKPSSCATADKLCPPSYFHIHISISKSMAAFS